MKKDVKPKPKIKKDVKSKLKPKIKKVVKSKDKIKINKQNQNVKVNIKIGNDGKSIDHKQPQSITTYPLLQNSPPPINIINNHENRHPPIAPPHVPIAPPHIPVNPIAPVNPITPVNPIAPIQINRLKKIKKTRRIRNVKVFDDIPDLVESGYGSGGSINYATPIEKISFRNPDKVLGKRTEPPIPFDTNDLLSAKKNLMSTPAKASKGYHTKILNPVSNRLITVGGKVYLRLAKDNDGTFPFPK